LSIRLFEEIVSMNFLEQRQSESIIGKASIVG